MKRFVPWAHVADVVLVPARAPEGLSLFLVDPRGAGVTVTPMVGIDLGNRWSELRLADAAVPADALVGPAGGAGPVLDTYQRHATLAAPPIRRVAAAGVAAADTFSTGDLHFVARPQHKRRVLPRSAPFRHVRRGGT